MLVRDGRVEIAFEYCAMAVMIALVTVSGTHMFGAHLGIVLNDVARLAG